MNKKLIFIFATAIFLTGCAKKTSPNSLVANNPSETLKNIEENKADLTNQVEEVRNERAQKAQHDGYPEAWQKKNLPEYQDAELTKTRELGSAVFVTLESNKEIPAVRAFYDQEMKKLGFNVNERTTNDFISMANYSKGTTILTIQVTKIADENRVKIQLDYKP